MDKLDTTLEKLQNIENTINEINSNQIDNGMLIKQYLEGVQRNQLKLIDDFKKIKSL